MKDSIQQLETTAAGVSPVAYPRGVSTKLTLEQRLRDYSRNPGLVSRLSRNALVKLVSELLTYYKNHGKQTRK